MLNAARLLKLASGKHGEMRPDPTDPTSENDNSGQQNLGEIRANPTDPTDPNKNPAMQQDSDGGPSPDPEELLHPRDCPQWWKGCLAGCPWYHPEAGGDFCWRVNRAWWEEPYHGGDE